jgi:cytoskeleton protein RodZ
MNTPDSSRPNPDMAQETSLGTLLTQQRIAKGLEQRDIASHLGLSLVLIRALEEDAFGELGAPVFVRGYLVRYARLLGLPEQDILNRYKNMVTAQPPPLRVSEALKPQARLTDASVRWFSYLLILGALGWLVWMGVEQVTTRLVSSELARRSGSEVTGQVSAAPPNSEPPPVQDQNSLATQPLPLTPRPFPETQSVPLSTATAVSTASGPQQANVPVAESHSAATSNLIREAPIPAAAPPPQLELTFREDCWVDIKDAEGNRLAYGLMKAKMEQKLSGVAPFSLLLGNSSAVQITLNGQTVDPAIYVKKGGVSRFVLDVPKQNQ